MRISAHALQMRIPCCFQGHHPYALTTWKQRGDGRSGGGMNKHLTELPLSGMSPECLRAPLGGGPGPEASGFSSLVGSTEQLLEGSEK